MRRPALLLALLLSLSASAAPREIAAERYDVTIRALTDGSIQVTETIRLQFRGGPFTYVNREVPTRMTDGIEVLGASMDGRVMKRGAEAGQFDVRMRDSRVAVRWHFASSSDSTHEFRLSYLVRGLIRREAGAGLLEWQALPSEHAYAIGASRIVLEGEGLDRQPSVRSRRVGRTQIARVNGRWEIDARAIERNGWVAIAAPAPLADAAAPRWQLRGDRQRALAPRMLLFGGLALAFGLFVVFLVWRQYPAGPLMSDTVAEDHPPAPRPPALAAAILAGGHSSNAHAPGTLFDLASQGALTVAETEGRWKLFRRFTLTRQHAAGLAPHESALLDALFRQENVVQSSTVASRLARGVKSFRREVNEELRRQGLIDDQRRGVRRRLFGVSIGLLVVSGVAAGVGLLTLQEAGPWIAAVPIGIMAAGAAAIALSVTLPELSDEGLRERERWRSFRRSLKERLGPDVLPHLPYVAATGLALPLSRALRRQGDTAALPPWFRALSSRGGSAAFAAFIGTTTAGAAGRSGGSGAAGGGSSSAG